MACSAIYFLDMKGKVEAVTWHLTFEFLIHDT